MIQIAVIPHDETFGVWHYVMFDIREGRTGIMLEFGHNRWTSENVALDDVDFIESPCSQLGRLILKNVRCKFLLRAESSTP